MSNGRLPERASLEYLKKLAKERLQEMRRTDPRAKLASALSSVAREHGFASWRALKAEVEARQKTIVVQFFEAADKGDVETVRRLLDDHPALARAAHPEAPHGGWTALHSAAQRGHAGVVRLLLERGADPNAREAGDNTVPLHWAAAHGHVEIVRALLDAGSDAHGFGDDHRLDVIGWASGAPDDRRREVVGLLLQRGARHHIFSAINMGDLEGIRRLVEENPEALDRRMSRFEHGWTPLHLAIDRKRYDILDLLLELGADVEAGDLTGQTAMTMAMMRSDREAMRRLQAAGATTPAPIDTSNFRQRMAKLAESTNKIVPGIAVPDIAAALEWYTSIGFKELGRHADDGVVNWGWLGFGKAEFMLGMHGKVRPRQPVSLWFYTDNVDALYELLKGRQVEAAQATLADPDSRQQGIEFVEDIYDPFYGGRQFSIRDPNGYQVIFYQE